MTSLINGITLKAVKSKEGVKQLQNEDVNFTKPTDTRQTSHGGEGKLYFNAADRRNRVTRQLFLMKVLKLLSKKQKKITKQIKTMRQNNSQTKFLNRANGKSAESVGHVLSVMKYWRQEKLWKST